MLHVCSVCRRSPAVAWKEQVRRGRLKLRQRSCQHRFHTQRYSLGQHANAARSIQMPPPGLDPAIAGYATLALANATASPGPPLRPADGGPALRAPAMTLQAVADALSHSSNADIMAPALGGVGGNNGFVQRLLKPSGSAIGKKRGSKTSAGGRRQQRNIFCPHNRRKQNCLECGTAILCPHNKRKAFCR